MQKDCCGPKTKDASERDAKTRLGAEKETLHTISFSVEGMHCGSCAAKIESALSGEPGVFKAVVDLSTRGLTVEIYDRQTSSAKLIAAVTAAGYQVVPNVPDRPGIAKVTSLSGLARQRPVVPPWLVGIVAAAGLVAFYLGLLTLVSDWESALMQLEDSQWWVLALAVGLGIQAALYTILKRHLQKQAIKGAGASLAASGGMSSASMAACCAHFVVPILPVLGLPFLSAAAVTLAEYQTWLFFFGVVSNLVGMAVMLRILHRNGLLTRALPFNIISAQRPTAV